MEARVGGISFPWFILWTICPGRRRGLPRRGLPHSSQANGTVPTVRWRASSKLECPYPLCDRYPCFCMAVGPRPGSAGRAGPRRWRRSPCLCHFSEVVGGQISASHLRLRSSTRGLSCSLTYVKPLTQHGRPSWFSQNTPDRYGWVWDIQTISEWIRLLCAITEHKKAAKCAMCSPQFLHFLPSI